MVSASGGLSKPKAHTPNVQNGVSKKPSYKTKRGKLQIAADILDSIDDYIYAIDRNWNFIYMNERNARDFGSTPQKLLGKNIWKLFPKFVGTSVEKNFSETMNKRVVTRFEWETIYAQTGFREFTVFPSPEGITVYGVDVTERKKLQQKLEMYAKNLEQMVQERTRKIRESEQSYRELYESFGEAFIATDWDLKIIHWNKVAERITDIPEMDALGKRIYEVLPEATSVDITPYLQALQKKKPARFMMNTTSRQTGKASIFEISTYPSEHGIIIIVEDKTLEEETKRLSTIGQTAGMVGHDIRNPLQSITSSIYLIKDDLDHLASSEEKTDALFEVDSIFEQIFYIDKIVADLQDYARPLKLENTEVDLKLLIQSALSTLNIPKDIEASTVFDEKIPNLRVDPMLLKRILINLATNAVQAMPDGGKLTINVSRKPTGEILISVEDTGIGIPEEVKSRVFTPLFTTKSKGQGFGLAVVKRLVETQGGTISFESQKGKGTKFIIKMPSPE